MRVDASSVMIFRLSTTPGTTSCSSPEYRSSVFSRTMTRSTPAEARGTTGGSTPAAGWRKGPAPCAADVDAGEPAADRRRHRALERDLVAPDRFEKLGRQRRRRDARARSTPASVGLPLAPADPAASRMRTTAPVTSGPMPSPGNQRDAVRHCLPRFPVEQRQRADQVHHHQPRRELMELVEVHPAGIAAGSATGASRPRANGVGFAPSTTLPDTAPTASMPVTIRGAQRQRCAAVDRAAR